MTKTCLNNWWDFLPVYDSSKITPTPPASGWKEKACLVPSFWTKSLMGIRKKGDTYFECDNRSYSPDEHAHIYDSGEYEFLFDAYNYPNEWSKTRTAWLRRSITVEEISPGTSYWLLCEAIAPQCDIFINNIKIISHSDAFLPVECNITDALHRGENEIAILVRNYEISDTDSTLTPSGNMLTRHFAGVWQNVYLLERGGVILEDVTIRTSTRNETIDIEFLLHNTTDMSHIVQVNAFISDWKREAEPSPEHALLSFDQKEVTLTPGESKILAVSEKWENAQWWYPEDPHLYSLTTQVTADGAQTDIHHERFGFREVWIDGPDIKLNGYPLHLFSDWGHKLTPYHHTREWNEKWFDMIRDANMNHSRLHTHPHPSIILDMADEQGILITNETAIHGSGNDQESDDPRFWDAAREHVRRFVARDKNHPCVVLWSVENEMRWNRNQTDLTKEELPILRKLFNEIDPTRPAYHEGDSSLWNEHAQDIISRHYGKECAALDTWDKSMPFHAGEMAIYHYEGPNNTNNIFGDRVYANYHLISKAAGIDTARIVEAGRTRGVACFGPWNLCCLENLRMDTEHVSLSLDDPTAPGIKPLQVPPHSSEFSFWKEGKGYTPFGSFDEQAHAFRPFALTDLSLRSGYIGANSFSRTIHIVNDLPRDISGSLTISLKDADSVIAEMSLPINVARGCVKKYTWSPDLSEPECEKKLTYSASFTDDDGAVLDSWSRSITFAPVNVKAFTQDSVALFGAGILTDFLTNAGLSIEKIDALEKLSTEKCPVCIIEQNAIIAGSAQNKIIQKYIREGGRVVLLEQRKSLFPGLEMEVHSYLTAFTHTPTHPVLDGVNEEDIAFWNDDPYAAIHSDAHITLNVYKKADCKQEKIILETGGGGFHDGDLESTPLLEIQEGKGMIIASQLRLTERCTSVPAARRILFNMINYALKYTPEEKNTAVQLYEKPQPENIASALQNAENGAIVILSDLDDSACALLSDKTGFPIALTEYDEWYQAVRACNDHPLLQSVSNYDLCGIETFAYSHADAKNYALQAKPLEPHEKIEPLLVTPTQSALKEMYAHTGKTEPLRAHTLSRFLFAEKPQEKLVAGCITLGKGKLILSQFVPPSDAPQRMSRFIHQLMSNAGHTFDKSLLDGDAVPSGKTISKGYPRELYVLDQAADDSTVQTMCDCCTFTGERMPPSQIFHECKWQHLSNEKNQWQPKQNAENTWLYFQIKCPTVRKNIDVDLDVPNPEAMTFLDLKGKGDATLYINGIFHENAVFQNGSLTFADIELEMGFNQILIKWTPESADDFLSLQWRNIMQEAETSFDFLDNTD